VDRLPNGALTLDVFEVNIGGLRCDRHPRDVTTTRERTIPIVVTPLRPATIQGTVSNGAIQIGAEIMYVVEEGTPFP